MSGLNTTIVEHRLPVLPDVILIRQQLRRMKSEVTLKIKEESRSLRRTGRSDYKDFNRASPKDNFSLSHIDILVDNTAQHAFYSFMDGFSRYN
ncbi:hypothetical protein CR513_40660, partial [Mucuna pruriens]